MGIIISSMSGSLSFDVIHCFRSFDFSSTNFFPKFPFGNWNRLRRHCVISAYISGMICFVSVEGSRAVVGAVFVVVFFWLRNVRCGC